MRIFARILDICDVGYPITLNGSIKRKCALDTLDDFIILIRAGNNYLNFSGFFLNLKDFKRREALLNRSRRVRAGHNSCILINCTYKFQFALADFLDRTRTSILIAAVGCAELKSGSFFDIENDART